MINHRISNLICRIRTAIINKKDGFIINHSDLFNSKELLELLSFLASGGYVYYSPKSNSWFLKSSPDNLSSLLSNIKVRSKPGKRMYRGYKSLVEDEVIRTSSGYKWSNEARNQRKGGERILKIDRGWGGN